MDKYIADALREHSDGLEEFMVRVYARVYMGQKRCCDPDSSNFGPEAPPEMEILEVVFKGTTVEVPDKYTTDDVYERLEEDGWESLD